MSIEAVEAIVRRAMADPIYRGELAQTPDIALHGYDLTVSEREALVSGDVRKLEELGASPAVANLAGRLNEEGSRTPR